jgi:hypothetical protein
VQYDDVGMSANARFFCSDNSGFDGITAIVCRRADFLETGRKVKTSPHSAALSNTLQLSNVELKTTVTDDVNSSRCMKIKTNKQIIS